MSHHHHHHGGHCHHHAPASYNTAFAVGTTLNLLYVAVEGGYGYFSQSLALMADAGHNFSDVIGLVLAWGASVLVKRKPTRKHTYGLRRTTILATLANAIILLLAIGGIAFEAIGRLRHPEPVMGNTMILVATIGIAINTATALLFVRGREKDINIQGAFLHMAADAVVSLGVVVAGFIIKATSAYWIDPVISLVIVLVIAGGTWSLLKQSVNMAMDAVPESIDLEVVKAYFEQIEGVTSVHDLHVWSMSTTEIALTVHLVAPQGLSDDALHQMGHELHEQFEIEHPTIQVERGDAGDWCPLASPEVV